MNQPPFTSPNRNDFPLSRQAHLVFDEITGHWFDPSDFPPPQQEYMVVSEGIMHAVFYTKADAYAYQLKSGLRASTTIISWPD